MRILITGGSGFIGANLTRTLLSQEHEVFCLDNFCSSTKNNLSEFFENNSFSLIEHDIIEPLPKPILVKDIDQIYHLACPASPPHYQKDPVFTLKTNFLGTLNILELAKNQKKRTGKSPTVLFTSTSEVYGDPEIHPQTEEYRGNVNPHGIRSCYDEGKRVAESLCMNYLQMYDIPVKIVRVFNTYGPKMDPNDGRVVSNFIVQSLLSKKLTIYGDGTQTRSFQYIDDLIGGMIKFMDLDERFPGPVNLGNPHEITVVELSEMISKILNKKIETKFLDLPQDDPIKRCPDITLAKQKLNWEPNISLENGLKKTIQYFRSIVSKKDS